MKDTVVKRAVRDCRSRGCFSVQTIRNKNFRAIYHTGTETWPPAPSRFVQSHICASCTEKCSFVCIPFSVGFNLSFAIMRKVHYGDVHQELVILHVALLEQYSVARW